MVAHALGCASVWQKFVCKGRLNAVYRAAACWPRVRNQGMRFQMSDAPKMPAMPLSMVKAGETVHVSRVKGNEDMKHHLNDLGFVEGSEVHVVSSSGANLIVTVLGARFGLDTKVAQHVMTVA